MSDQPVINSPEQKIQLPKPSTPARPADEMIVLNAHTVYYFVIAIVFFVAGFAVAYASLGAIVNTAVSQVRADVSMVAGQAVATAVAAAPRGAVANAPRPTETPVPVQQIEVGDSPFWGPADAKVTVIEYSDFECPFCSMFYQQTYALLRDSYGDRVKFVFKHLPLTQIHPNALPAALASECAREQGKFWEYHDILFPNYQNLNQAALLEHAKAAGVANMEQFSQCFQSAKYRDRVVADVESATSHFVNATPTFFINGVHVPGAVPYETIAAYIDRALQQAGG